MNLGIMNVEIITVATHSEGLFDDLINNNYNQKIKVLGFGEKWTGFKMKFELVYDYIKNLPDDKIIIFLDGFDTIIKGTAQQAVERFMQLNSKILFSEELENSNFGIEKAVFPVCKNNKIVNTGMYIGYVKYLKLVYKEILQKKCRDDQVVLNRLCKKFQFIDIDENEYIFKNIYNTRNIESEIKNSKALFFSQPGNYNWKRVFRAIMEYGQFLLIYILILYFILIYFFYKSKKYYLLTFITLIFGLYFMRMEKSCI